MTDYAIARRIVDLHARNIESVERVYSTDEIQRYILFARQFQPKARHHLTRFYVLCLSQKGKTQKYCLIKYKIRWSNWYPAFSRSLQRLRSLLWISTSVCGRGMEEEPPNRPGESQCGSWRVCCVCPRPWPDSTALMRSQHFSYTHSTYTVVH